MSPNSQCVHHTYNTCLIKHAQFHIPYKCESAKCLSLSSCSACMHHTYYTCLMEVCTVLEHVLYSHVTVPHCLEEDDIHILCCYYATLPELWAVYVRGVHWLTADVLIIIFTAPPGKPCDQPLELESFHHLPPLSSRQATASYK